MKKYLMVLYICLFAACVNKGDFNETSITLTSEQCERVLASYLTTEDNLYNLLIPSDEAVGQGIPIKEYDRFCKLMDDVNKALMDAKEQGIPIYGMESEKILFTRTQEGISEYPDLLYRGKFLTHTSDYCKFQGSSSIYIYASSNDPVWAIGFENVKNGDKFVMSGDSRGEFNERVYSVIQGSWFTDWEWNLVKLGGSEVSYSFWGCNCLNIEGTLAKCVLKVINYDPASYTIQLKNEESNYKRAEIYWGTWKVGEAELNPGQSYTKSNCSYGDRYTVKIFNGWGTEVGNATFNLNKLWQFI